MIRPGPKATARQSRREGMRHGTIVTAICGLIGLCALLWHGIPVELAPAPARAPALSAGSSDEEIYTGSILYMPQDGKTCRQHLFDNNSGRLFDNGTVDCARAAYRPASGPPMNWSVARTHVISYGFRNR
jgi:hypothetical protein